LALPELVPCQAKADIVVRFASVERPQGARCDGPAHPVWGTAQEVHLEWEGVGAFVVRDGTEIVVDPLPGVDERVLRLCILGACLGIVLLQRGLTVFHASVVGLPDSAIAFLAFKGCGKSTTAAAMHARGHRLVADDILVSDDMRTVGAEAPLMVRPGFPQLKLWPEVARALGHDPEALPVLHPALEKRAHRVSNGFSQRPLPLQGIYVLGSAKEIEIVPLKPNEALIHVLPHWYGAMLGGELLRAFGLDTHFGETMRLVKQVPVYLLKRPSALDGLPEVARAVEEHALGTREALRAGPLASRVETE
jgi:hypothetical protein